MNDELLDSLNAPQREAVTHTEGPLLIIAGAGTGKTTVITRRIAWLIREGKAKPEELLALTFTEKAAQEMEERVDQLLPYGYTDTWIMTFHGFAERALREFATHVGLPSDFTVLDETETYLLIRRHFEKFTFEYFKIHGNPARHISDLYRHFSRLKDEGITPERYTEFVTTKGKSAEPDEEKRLLDLARAYEMYERILKEEGVVDFGGLMLELNRLLTERPLAQKQLAERFKYILVDEFQDTNTVQYQIVKRLLVTHRNLTVVGDDDQAIYRFRGASLANLLSFVDEMPEARRIVLIDNYRSKQEILDTAHAFIQANNPHRLEAKLAGDGAISKKLNGIGSGGIVEELVFDGEEDEARGVAEKILAHKIDDPSLSWRDFVILVRANHSAGPFVQALELADIPFRFYGLEGLYTSPVVIDMLCLSRVAVNAFDGQAMARVLAHAAWKLPDEDYMRILHTAAEKGKPIFDVMKQHSALEMTHAGHDAVELILKAQATAAESARKFRPTEAFLSIVHAFEFLKHLNSYPEDVRREAMALLSELYARIKRYDERARQPSLADFITNIADEMDLGDTGSRAPDPEAGPDVVKIMTVHASKGLEFAYVFICHMVDQRFPSQNRQRGIQLPEGLLDEQHKDAMSHLSEERRLLYVAMTRGKRGVYLTRARDYGGERKKKPSRFLIDMGFAQNEPEPKSKKEEDEFKLITRAPREATEKAHVVKKLSFTQIAAFQTCPLQYKYAHILRIPIIGKPTKSFGTSMHNALQDFMAFPFWTDQTQPRPEQSELLALLDEHWVDEWYPSDEKRDEYRTKAKESLKKFYDVTMRELPKPAYLEQEFTVKIGGIPLKGRIDRIDTNGEAFEIIDYKSGKPKSEEEVLKSFDVRRQLALYQLAAEDVLKIPVNKLTLWYLDDNSRVSYEPKPKDVIKIREEIEEVVEGLAHSDFAPRPDFACKYCDFKDICDFAQRG
jgi:DNA helicase-2/ATP-dependent DNA helicase PcrA